MTMRLSQSSLTGTERTLVAVGTVRLASMFCTVRAGAPLRTVNVGSSEASDCSFFGESLGVGLASFAVVLPSAFFVWAASLAWSPFWSPFFSDFCSLFWVLFTVSGFASAGFCSDFSLFAALLLAAGLRLGAPVDSVTAPLEVAASGLAGAAAFSLVVPPPRSSLPKKSHQTLSTLSGFFW